MHERVKLAVRVFNHTSSPAVDDRKYIYGTQAPTYVAGCYIYCFCYLIHLPCDRSGGNAAYIPLQIQSTKKKLTILFIINKSFCTQMLN